MIIYYQFYTYTTINNQYPTFVVFKYAGLWYRETGTWQKEGRKIGFVPTVTLEK